MAGGGVKTFVVYLWCTDVLIRPHVASVLEKMLVSFKKYSLSPWVVWKAQLKKNIVLRN